MGARDKFGNRPFERLKLAQPIPKPPPKPAGPPKRSVPPTKAPPRAQAAEIDELLFAQAMHDVRPLPEGPERTLATPLARLPDPDAEDREVQAQLEGLVNGEATFHLSDSDEFMEGAVAELDRRTRQRLRRAEFAVQAHLDLHGQTREEAHAALEAFVKHERTLGHRCVLVIHGRGLNSKGQIPVLKEQMGRWLSRGALGKQVLAFCTARPCDGGAGALYVLLRR
jgi:DNA-nicking Smr family endonuclease